MWFSNALLAILIYSKINDVVGYPSGAPDGACESMTPGHPASFQQVPSPYIVSSSSDCRNVAIQGTPNFKGFLIKAFNSSNQTVGKFLNAAITTQITCQGQAVTHSQGFLRNFLNLAWDSDGYVGSVYFKATVVENYTLFWSITSSPCSAIRIGTLSPTTTNAYNGSGITPQKSCPSNGKCFQCSDENCVITWSKGKDGYVDFQVSAYVSGENRYLAMALSYDQLMGNDSVTLCWKTGGGYTAEMRYIGENKTVKGVENPLESLVPGNIIGSYSENWMVCQFSKKIHRGTNSSALVYYLDEGMYYLLFATGVMDKDQPTFHERKTPSTTQYNFTDFTVPTDISSMTHIKTCPQGGGCFACNGGLCTIVWTAGDPNYVNFQISAPVQGRNSYVAMAFSKDNKMGDDSITLCSIPDSSDTFTAEMWYSVDHGIQRVSNPHVTLNPNSISGLYSESTMSCKFSKQIKDPATLTKRSDDLVYYIDEQYYLFFATGQVIGGIPQQHVSKFFSSSKLNLTDFNSASLSSSPSNSLIKAHGILMVIAWLMAAAVSILLPRYFKPGWPNAKIFQKPLWFIFHQSLMIFVFTLTSIAFIIIFCEVRGYAYSDNPIAQAHPPLGIIVMILVFMNPVMAIFRCSPDSRHRWIFNSFHSLVGQFALVIAVINIFLSFYIPNANIGPWVKWVMVALICWHVSMEILLIIHEKYIYSHSQKIGKNDNNSAQLGIEEETSEPNNYVSAIKTVLILAQFVGVTGLAIAICVGIGTA